MRSQSKIRKLNDLVDVCWVGLGVGGVGLTGGDFSPDRAAVKGLKIRQWEVGKSF